MATQALRRGQATGRLSADCDPDGAASFIVAALEGAILMSKVTKEIRVLEQCVQELKEHLTLYSKSRANDFSHVPRLGAEESYDERATG